MITTIYVHNASNWFWYSTLGVQGLMLIVLIILLVYMIIEFHNLNRPW